jgi:hypothetical protein
VNVDGRVLRLLDMRLRDFENRLRPIILDSQLIGQFLGRHQCQAGKRGAHQFHMRGHKARVSHRAGADENR